MSRLSLALLVSVVVVVGLAGCGGGGDSGTVGTSGAAAKGASAPSARKPVISEGDAICGNVPLAYGEKLKALEKRSGGKRPSEAEIVMEAALPPLFAAVREFEALQPPSGADEEFEEIIEAFRIAIKGVEQSGKLEFTGPKSPFAEFQKLTKEFGFTVCPNL